MLGGRFGSGFLRLGADSSSTRTRAPENKKSTPTCAKTSPSCLAPVRFSGQSKINNQKSKISGSASTSRPRAKATWPVCTSIKPAATSSRCARSLPAALKTGIS